MIERPPTLGWRRWRDFAWTLTCVLSLSLGGCDKDREDSRRPSAPHSASKPAPVRQASVPAVVRARYGSAPRVVAIGDLHGDLDATRRALRLAGAIDDSDGWTGGSLVVVQTGDQLDRGDDEREILELFDDLAVEAQAAGGALHVLNGNHETMNVAGDFRYATPGGFRDFEDVPVDGLPQSLRTQLAPPTRGRAAAFFPGGPFAVLLAKRDVIAIVGDSVFVHGGVLPAVVEYGVDRLNSEASAWMRGDSPKPPAPIEDSEGPVWTRRYSSGRPDCAALAKTLELLGVKRMVVGHTPQPSGVTSACQDRVWRIDTGMAHHYGGMVQILEIRGDAVRVLKEPAAAE